MSEWIAVVSEEGEEPIEIPTESDGTMLLSTLSAQFPKVTGLKFRNPESNLLRGVRCHDNTLFPPIPPNPEAGEAGGAGSWGGHTYICTMPPSAMKMVSKKVSEVSLNASSSEAALKRKSENDPGMARTKNQRVDENDDSDDLMDDDDGDTASAAGSGTSDLIVLGLPWVASEADIREYFETFGPLAMVLLKTGQQGKSKGFAFIRFKEMEPQAKVLLTRHMIKDRWCDVKVPESQELKVNKEAASCKIFVTNITQSMTNEDLREHFETFGTVTDVYIPKPHRKFAFISFSESRVAQSLFGKDHVIKGISCHIGQAKPKSSSNQSGKTYRDDRGGGRDDDRRDYGGPRGFAEYAGHGPPQGHDAYGRYGPPTGGYGPPPGGQGYSSPWMAGNGPTGPPQDNYSNYYRGNRGPPRGYY